MSGVYVIRESGSTEAMERVHCASEDRELQILLEKNPDLLPGDQIDPEEPRRWLLVKREMPVPDPNSGANRWSIDFLFADQEAMPTFVECKRFADTRARREIVGQMIEYAANGHHYWSKEELLDYARESARTARTTLEERFAALRPEEPDTVDEFFERIQHNLREGQLRIVFFLEESPLELRSVVDFLNRQMERSEVLLVEARQYSHAGAKVVVPTLFGYTEEARVVKRAVTVKQASRRRWDRDSFFRHARATVGVEGALVMEALLDHCLSLDCRVTWGTGVGAGSFNVKEPMISTRSFISCFSTGNLDFNFGWLDTSEAALRSQARLRELADQEMGLDVGDSGWFRVGIDEWAPRIDSLKSLIQDLLKEARGSA